MPSLHPYIGCAGWSIPKHLKDQFSTSGTHLARYAEHFNAVEINSSFYRSHQGKTYQRWASSTPDHFRFAVKVPKEITHESRLIDCSDAIDQFLDEVANLEAKLGPLLVQLPPSFEFEKQSAERFFNYMRNRTESPIVCEPRHASWFDVHVDELLKSFRISRVAADPAPVPQAAQTGGWPSLNYFRLHGSPRIYYSSYEDKQLSHYAHKLCAACSDEITSWCIFDNTALGAAYDNALHLSRCVMEAKN